MYSGVERHFSVLSIHISQMWSLQFCRLHLSLCLFTADTNLLLTTVISSAVTLVVTVVDSQSTYIHIEA